MCNGTYVILTSPKKSLPNLFHKNQIKLKQTTFETHALPTTMKIANIATIAFFALAAGSIEAKDGLRTHQADRHLQSSLADLEADVADAESLLDTFERRLERRKRRGRDTSRLERRIANLEAEIGDLLAEIANFVDPSPPSGEVISLTELATRALADDRFDMLSDFTETFSADDVTELLSRTSRAQNGFLDFFFQRMRCPFPQNRNSSTRRGDDIDDLRVSVAADLGVQIDEFLCPSLRN